VRPVCPVRPVRPVRLTHSKRNKLFADVGVCTDKIWKCQVAASDGWYAEASCRE